MSGAARDVPWVIEDKPSGRPEWYSGHLFSQAECHSGLQGCIVSFIAVSTILLFAHVRGAHDVTFGNRVRFDTRPET